MRNILHLTENKETEKIPLSLRPLFLDELVLMQKYAIASWSYYKIDEYEPLSFIFSKASGHGGSEILNVFNNSIFITPLVYWKQELTTIDIYDAVYTAFKTRGKRILSIEDMNRILSKNKSVVSNLFTAFLLMIQKNGLTDIISRGGLKVRLNPPLKMSLFCSITNEVLDHNYINWFRMGLIDRLIIPTWRLTEQQEENIKCYINSSLTKEKMNYKPKVLNYGLNVKIEVNPKLLEPLSKEAKEITDSYFNYYLYLKNRFADKYKRTEEKEEISKQEQKITCESRSKFKPTKLRKYKKLILLTIGKAISEHRKKITEEDVNFICKLSDKYFKLRYNEISGVMVTENKTYER